MTKSRNLIDFFNKHKLPFVVLCLLFVLLYVQLAIANNEKKNDSNVFIDEYYSMLLLNKNISTDSIPQKANNTEIKKIKLIYASRHVKRPLTTYEILLDSVELEHEGALLFCDSAYFDSEKNTFEAFGNVKMNEGDSLFLYGDYMEYDGHTQFIKIRNNVLMENASGKLYTDSLNYDRIKDIGFYTDWGSLVDSVNILTSEKGYFEPNKNLATFIKDVEVEGEQFKMFSDTLLYNTETKIVSIVSETRIEADSGFILGNRGNFNTITQLALLLDQSIVESKDRSKLLKGDSIVFVQNSNKGEVFGNMFLIDSLQQIIIKGDYGLYKDDYGYALATERAELISYGQGDSLFIHADSLEMYKYEPILVERVFEMEKGDTITLDTIEVGQANYLFKAYHNVRFYKNDMQGVCDSLTFSSADSLLQMYKQPILWNEGNQLTGDSIQILMNDSTIEKMFVKNNAFSIEFKEDNYYNQLKSRYLTIDFKEGKVSKIFAEGNVESIAYPEGSAGKLDLIQNFLVSSFLDISIENNEFQELKAWPKPTGSTTPFSLLSKDKLQLQNFKWYDYLRPIDRNDIFRKIEVREEDKRKERPKILDESWDN